MGWALVRMGEMRSTCKVLVGIYEVKRPLERTRNKWEDNIKMEVGGC
jgi:hypothetical protein